MTDVGNKEASAQTFYSDKSVPKNPLVTGGDVSSVWRAGAIHKPKGSTIVLKQDFELRRLILASLARIRDRERLGQLVE